jgi:hypothetical protein
MSNDPTDIAIAMLERGMEEAEEKLRSLRAAVNTICVQAGRPPRYTVDQLAAASGNRITQIKDDTFYGKKQTTAMREYLEMRKAQNQGPATPREIYESLKAGGYQFGASEEASLVGMRALLRTQPDVFHKLPQGTYGLISWYPDAKRQREESKGKKKGGSKKKRAAGRAQKPAATASAQPAVKPTAKPAEKQKPPLKVVEANAETPTPKNQKAA